MKNAVMKRCPVCGNTRWDSEGERSSCPYLAIHRRITAREEAVEPVLTGRAWLAEAIKTVTVEDGYARIDLNVWNLLCLNALRDPAPQPEPSTIRLHHDEYEPEGEVFATGVKYIHVEQMDKGLWWMRIELPDGRAIVGHLRSKKPIHATWEED